MFPSSAFVLWVAGRLNRGRSTITSTPRARTRLRRAVSSVGWLGGDSFGWHTFISLLRIWLWIFYRRGILIDFVFCRFLAICCCRLACTVSARSSPTAPPRQRRHRGPDGPTHTPRPQIAMSTQDAGPGSPHASEEDELGEFTLIGRGGRPSARPATGEAPTVSSQGGGGGAAPSFAAVAARAAAASPRPDAESGSTGRRPAARRTSPSAEATPRRPPLPHLFHRWLVD